VSKCSGHICPSLHSHCAANIDLYLTQTDQTIVQPLPLAWVRGHADKKPWEDISDLKNQQLLRDEIFNVGWLKLRGPMAGRLSMTLMSFHPNDGLYFHLFPLHTN